MTRKTRTSVFGLSKAKVASHVPSVAVSEWVNDKEMGVLRPI